MMVGKCKYDWDPKSKDVLDNQIAAYDEMRRRYGVARSAFLHWSLFRHEDVMRVLMDDQTFSAVVSAHLSVPNGMDPPEHTKYRRIIERYFGPAEMAAFEPACRTIAARLVSRLPTNGEVEFMRDFAQAFALQIQCAFMGWPEELHEPLRQWTRRNHEATLAGDREAMASVAIQFDGYIRDLLDVRRSAGDHAPDDVTTRLLREQMDGRLLDEVEIVSIIRNWTVGELATISACVGILAEYLAQRPALQQSLREKPADLPAAIDEILRIHAPLIANRRVATKTVKIGGRTIEAGERVSLIWASANRDEAVFGDPDAFRPDRDPADNLLYGAGVHVCPGAPLARLELRVVMEELLARTAQISGSADRGPVRAAYPGSGFSSLPLQIEEARSAHPANLDNPR